MHFSPVVRQVAHRLRPMKRICKFLKRICDQNHIDANLRGCFLHRIRLRWSWLEAFFVFLRLLRYSIQYGAVPALNRPARPEALGK